MHTGNVALLSQPAGPNQQYVSTFGIFMLNNFENVKIKQFILHSGLKTDKRSSPKLSSNYKNHTPPETKKSRFPLMWTTQNVGGLWFFNFFFLFELKNPSKRRANLPTSSSKSTRQLLFQLHGGASLYNMAAPASLPRSALLALQHVKTRKKGRYKR